jgi:hypothetical protein
MRYLIFVTAAWGFLSGAAHADWQYSLSGNASVSVNGGTAQHTSRDLGGHLGTQ